MTVPEMGRMLGLDRRDAWKLYRHEKDRLEMIRVAGKPRITRESFAKWYAVQKQFELATVADPIRDEIAADSDHKEYVLIREAAEYLGISEKRVYRLVENGTFTGKKIGKTRLIRYADVVRYEKED